MENTTLNKSKFLKTQWEVLKKENPKTRIRDAAKQLDVSEVELLAISPDSTLLNPNFEEILKEISSLGYVMALTRNDFAVHERKGEYKKARFNKHVGLVVTPEIDLRLFMSNWAFAFAVNENERKSIQFFSKDGSAIHKIYLTEKSNYEAYSVLIDKYKSDQEFNSDQLEEVSARFIGQPDSEVNIPSFQEAWLNLKDTHEFHGLLMNHKLDRMQALRLAPDGYSKEIRNDAVKNIINAASEANIDIMVFVGNSGCIQIHTGKVQKLVLAGGWFNVLDPEFNLHLKEEGIVNTWLVKKPTNLGIVTSIEAFDSNGDIIIQLFGKRKPNIPEREDWREIVSHY